MKTTGTCKWFNSTKGYGFITTENGEDIFVHQSDIHAQGFRSLAEGESLEFIEKSDPQGRKKAVQVTGPSGAPVQGEQRSQRQEGGGGFGGGRDQGYGGAGGGGFGGYGGGQGGGGARYGGGGYSGGSGGGGYGSGMGRQDRGYGGGGYGGGRDQGSYGSGRDQGYGGGRDQGYGGGGNYSGYGGGY